MRRVDTGSPELNLLAAVYRQAVNDANEGDSDAWRFLKATADDLIAQFDAVSSPPVFQMELFSTLYVNYEKRGQYGAA